MTLHDNSSAALKEQKASGRSGYFREAVLTILETTGRPMTDREIMDILQETDPNNVRPEITRLKQAGVIREVDKTTCPRTRKRVRRTAINTHPPV